MKKRVILAAMLALALAAVSGLSACSLGRTDSSGTVGGVRDSSDLQDDSSSDDPIPDDCTVRFDTDGGGSIANVSVKKGGKISKPATPTKITQECEYVFLGWFYNGVEWDFDTDTVSEDMTLIARWKEGNRYTDPFLPKN